MRILCIGISHKTAEVALRERLALDTSAVRTALEDLVDRWPDAQMLVLSTCNRTEIYVARAVHGHPREDQLRAWLGEFTRVPRQEYDAAVFALADADAIEHLFAVTSGLDSLIVGEAQIVSQVKAAAEMARATGTAGSVLGELLETALHVAKHVRSETGLGEGKCSVASVAIECAEQVLGSLTGQRVLAVGAGKMTALMLRHLRGRGAENILVTNRSADAAATLAAAAGGHAVPFGQLAETIASADVVLTSTASEAPILTTNMVARAQDKRDHAPLLILDMAVPRDVAPATGRLENVFLYNIDDLERIVRVNHRLRHDQRHAADAIVRQHVQEALVKLRIRSVAPTIDALYRRLEAIAAEEFVDARNKLSQHDDAEQDSEIVQRALHRTIRRILHPCAEKLRGMAGADNARVHAAVLAELFDLGDEVRPPEPPAG